MLLLKKLGRLLKMNKIFCIAIVFITGCGTKEVARPHLHNFPYLEDCPSLEERHIENEAELKAQAKALNMRYVDYLHFLSNKVKKENSHLNIVRD